MLLAKVFGNILVAYVLTDVVTGRIHHINLKNDARQNIALTAFGYAHDGRLYLRISNFTIDRDKSRGGKIGFTFSKGEALMNLERNEPSQCMLDAHPGDHPKLPRNEAAAIFMILDLEDSVMRIERAGDAVEHMVACADFNATHCDGKVRVPRKKRRVVRGHTQSHSGDATDPVKQAVPKAEVERVFGKTTDDKQPADEVENVGGESVRKQENAAEQLDNKPGKNVKQGSKEHKYILKSGEKLIDPPLKKKPTEEASSGSSDRKPQASDDSIGQTDNQKPLKITPKPQGVETSTFFGAAVQKSAPSLLKEIPLICEEGHGCTTQVTFLFSRAYEPGRYNLEFHNCLPGGTVGSSDNDDPGPDGVHISAPNGGSSTGDGPSIPISMTLYVEERNPTGFLDAGETLNVRIYFTMSVIFFLTGLIWLTLLKRASGNAFKIHYLMSVLIFLKSFSLLFHGVNFYFIEKYGHQREVWAVVYYIMHLLKGALLFGIVVLIGTGWTFFKNFLTNRDKKIFMIIIPLQVLDNIALIIVEESEMAQQHFQFWFQLFILVDVACCACIILPVIW